MITSQLKNILLSLAALSLSMGTCITTTGCASQQKTQDVLTVLERGNARGHLVVTTSGQLEAGQTISFFAGARGTSVSFDGNIDFAGQGETNEILEPAPALANP